MFSTSSRLRSVLFSRAVAVVRSNSKSAVVRSLATSSSAVDAAALASAPADYLKALLSDNDPRVVSAILASRQKTSAASSDSAPSPLSAAAQELKAAGQALTPAQEIAAAHAAYTKGSASAATASDSDFSQFRPKSKFAAAKQAVAAAAVTASADVKLDEEPFDLDSLFPERDLQYPPEDYRETYYYTQHIRDLIRAVEAKNLDTMFDLYHNARVERLSRLRDAVAKDVAAAKQLKAQNAERKAREMNEYELEQRAVDALGTFKVKGGDVVFDPNYLTKGPDYLEYEIMLDGCAQAGRLDLVTTIVEDMVHDRCLILPVHYTIMLKACVIAQDPEATLRLWNLLQASHGVRPDSHAYACGIYAEMARGNFYGAFTLFNKMKREGLQPTEAAFTFLYEGLFRLGRADMAHYLWRTVKATRLFKPDQSFYEMVATGFATKGASADVAAVIQRMRQKRLGGYTPSASLYRLAFDKFVADGKFRDAAELVANMNEDGVLRTGAVDRDHILRAAESFTDEKDKNAVLRQLGMEAAGGVEDAAPSTSNVDADVVDTFFDKPADYINVPPSTK